MFETTLKVACWKKNLCCELCIGVSSTELPLKRLGMSNFKFKKEFLRNWSAVMSIRPKFPLRGRSQTTFTRGGWSKKSTFCKVLYRRKCKWRGIGGQKITNLVNVVFERPLMSVTSWSFSFDESLKARFLLKK